MLRIEKLHLEMNMARHFMDMNWDDFCVIWPVGWAFRWASLKLRRRVQITTRSGKAQFKITVSVNDYPYTWLPQGLISGGAYKRNKKNVSKRATGVVLIEIRFLVKNA